MWQPKHMALITWHEKLTATTWYAYDTWPNTSLPVWWPIFNIVRRNPNPRALNKPVGLDCISVGYLYEHEDPLRTQKPCICPKPLKHKHWCLSISLHLSNEISKQTLLMPCMVISQAQINWTGWQEWGCWAPPLQTADIRDARDIWPSSHLKL